MRYSERHKSFPKYSTNLEHIKVVEYKVNTEAKMDFYETIEKARKDGKIEKGINEVTKAIERGTAKIVVVAKDVNPKEIIAHLAVLCKEKKVQYEEVDSKQKLGIAAGIQVGCSAVAIVAEAQKKESKK